MSNVITFDHHTRQAIEMANSARLKAVRDARQEAWDTLVDEQYVPLAPVIDLAAYRDRRFRR